MRSCLLEGKQAGGGLTRKTCISVAFWAGVLEKALMHANGVTGGWMSGRGCARNSGSVRFRRSVAAVSML